MPAQHTASTDLKNWLHTSRWLGLVLPLSLLVLALFLVLVVLVNLSNRAGQDTFERQAEVRVLEMASLLADQLEQDLTALQSLGELLASQTQRSLSQSPPQQKELLESIRKSSQGVLYSSDPDAAALYFSARQERSLEKDRDQLLRFKELGPLLQDIYARHELISQVYINTRTTETLIYPWIDVVEQFAHDVDVREFPFYYLADTSHNPEHEPIWIDTYLDPAGKGWMLSLSLPVVVDGEVVAVAGLDLTLDALVNRIMDLSPPWKGYTLLMAADGTLLAFPPESEEHWGVTLRRAHSSGNEETLNLLLRQDLRSQLDPLRQDASGLIPLSLREEEVLLSWSTLETNGWKLLLVAPREAVFSARQELLEDYHFLLWLGAACLFLSSVFFVILSSRRDRKILQQVKQESRMTTPAQVDREVLPVAPGDDLLQQIPGPLLVAQFDGHERLEACNTAFEQFAKSTRSELKGQLLAPLLGLEKLPAGNWMDELELSDDQQKIKTWWLTLSRHDDHSGFAFLLDLTRYSLTQQQLRSERQRARQAAKMKAEFSQVVIREANSLLSELHQASRLMANLEKSQDCHKKITAVQRLLDDLRDMSDESELLEEKEAEQQTLNLQSWIAESRGAVDAELEQQQRSLQVELDEDLPAEVMVDRRRMTRLLRHLLRQTLQLASEGDLHLQLSWLSHSSSLELVLRDEGGSLPVEERIKRFQSSTPLGSNYEPATGGLGMGPLLTRQLIQELKGSLEASSRPEGGMQLRLELPVTAVVEQQPLARILVVDDGPVNSMLASSVLEKSGYQVDVANSGRRALELGRKQDYSLVLMDIFMPEMDGLETTRRWRQLPGRNAGIPLIALTANALESDRDYFIAEGMDDYLAKPYRPAELRSRVDYWLNKKEVGF
ncbi:response regulator [Marinospirillum sp.]|uniref:response regulator n=1 Tax=Marinospirillum sp. TaxID=2183934 RepID=UPI00287062DE|nr:response regulator [Marinospirillum sp.]MDR9467038.1 response regulator [Marinospirillum sp.]